MNNTIGREEEKGGREKLKQGFTRRNEEEEGFKA
jgi:hypothetical protein